MDLKKRGLALLMCICMIMTLLPVAAFADDAAVVYGQYTDGVWQQDPSSEGSVTYEVEGGNSLTLSKTATALGDNTYRIDLKVISTQTTTTTPPGRCPGWMPPSAASAPSGIPSSPSPRSR